LESAAEILLSLSNLGYSMKSDLKCVFLRIIKDSVFLIRRMGLLLIVMVKMKAYHINYYMVNPEKVG